MRSLFFLFSIFLVFPCLTYGQQKHMSGLWEGTITDGIYAKEGKKFSLYLSFDGTSVNGQTTVVLDDGSTIDMKIEGHLYRDRSMYFEEVKNIPIKGIGIDPPYNRKYQLFYFRSIFESTIEGYWQQIREDKVLDDTRPRGRIFLKKVEKSDKA
ncbi:MAG: hypothetical protein MRY78_03945 [Saprospiraceae bacterium]|nr:hypothetical protein [Saprospiraceae bacterium]